MNSVIDNFRLLGACGHSNLQSSHKAHTSVGKAKLQEVKGCFFFNVELVSYCEQMYMYFGGHPGLGKVIDDAINR